MLLRHADAGTYGADGGVACADSGTDRSNLLLKGLLLKSLPLKGRRDPDRGQAYASPVLGTMGQTTGGPRDPIHEP